MDQRTSNTEPDDGLGSVKERESIPIVPVRVDVPEETAQRAREIARNSDNPEKRVGDYLDEAMMLNITYYDDDEPIND